MCVTLNIIRGVVIVILTAYLVLRSVSSVRVGLG